MSNELSEAIAMARRVHDRMTGPADGQVIINGTIIRALELMAGQAEQPTTKACGFDPALVERLVDVARVAWEPRHATLTTVVEAVLAELANVPCELPTDDEYAASMRASGLVSRHIDDWTKPIERLVTSRVAPILAAKDARIAELETRHEQGMAAMQAALNASKAQVVKLDALCEVHQKELTQLRRIHEICDDHKIDRTWRTMRNEEKQNNAADRVSLLAAKLGEARERVAELERDVTTARIQRDSWSQKESETRVRHDKIMMSEAALRDRVAELERRLADSKRYADEWHDAVNALSELWPKGEPIEDNPGQGEWIRKLVGLKDKRIAELENQLRDTHRHIAAREHELSQLRNQVAALGTSGQTPGQVFHAAYIEDLNTEDAASAVLRVFGGAALRKVRSDIVQRARQMELANGEKWFLVSSVETVELIDSELAKLESLRPSRAEAAGTTQDARDPAKSTHETACPACNGTGDSLYEPNMYCNKCIGEGKV